MVLQIPPAIEGTAGRLPVSDGKGETGDETMPDILQDKEKKNKIKKALAILMVSLTALFSGIGIYSAVKPTDKPAAIEPGPDGGDADIPGGIITDDTTESSAVDDISETESAAEEKTPEASSGTKALEDYMSKLDPNSEAYKQYGYAIQGYKTMSERAPTRDYGPLFMNTELGEWSCTIDGVPYKVCNIFPEN